MHPTSVKAHLASLVTYGCVGVAVSTLYSLSVWAMVEPLGLARPVVASVLAFCLVSPLSFAAQKYITFRNRPFDPRQPVRFAVMAASSFLMAVGGMYVITNLLKLHYGFGILLAWVLIPLANFIINTIWVFPELPSEERPLELSNLS